MKYRFFTPLFLIFLLVMPFSAIADEREEPIDVIIALDKSLSMVEEIEAVKEYVNTYLIDELLIDGDFFLVVSFYGKTEIPVSLEIQGPEDKERARTIIGDLLADGRFTDIGNALDVLGEQVEKYSSPDRKKFLLLITDGIQEAPPESKYYSPDGTFNHEFLENTKVIQKMGWKVHILGVGAEQAAQRLAEELAGTYTDLSEQPTAEELVEKTKEFLASMEVSSEVTMSPVDNRGRSRLSLTVESKGYTETKTVALSALRLTLPDGMEQNILPEAVTFAIEPESTTEIDIPVRIPSPPQSGEHTGSLRLVFSSEDHFLPVILEVSYQVKSFLSNFWWWILIGAVVLLLVIVLLILLFSRLKKVKHRFRLVVVKGKAATETTGQIYKIVEGKPLYLESVESEVLVNPKRNPDSIARLMAIQKGVRMTVLKPERFPKLYDAPLDIRDFDFLVRLDLEKRKDVTVRLARIT